MADDLTPEQRRLRAQIGAYRLHALGRTNTGPARRAFDERFVNEVDPARTLSESERAKRVAAARSAYFKSLALKSSKARSKRKPDSNA
jgi:hypothetical protein